MQERPPVKQSMSIAEMNSPLSHSHTTNNPQQDRFSVTTYPSNNVNGSIPITLPDTIEELQELDGDSDVLQEYFSQLDKVTNMQAVLDDLHNGNKVLAESNLAKQDTLNNQRQKLDELWTQQNQLREKLNATVTEYEQLADRYKSSACIATLRTAVSQADTQAEETAIKFLENADSGDVDKSGNIDLLLRKFRSERRRYHMLASKLEIVIKNGV